MFELKRAAKHTEELKVGDETLTIDIDIEKVAKDYRKKQLALIDAQNSLKASDEPVDLKYEKLGNAVIEIFKLIFGDENTDKILSFYDGNYAEMLVEAMPYVKNELVPQIMEKAQKMKADVKKRYKQ